MGLSLNKRPCHLGKSVNTRTEMHGDTPTPAADLTLLGIMLDKDELNGLFNVDPDPKMQRDIYKALFNTKGKMAEPMLPEIHGFKLAHKFDKSRVTVYLGIDNEKVELAGCKLAKIELNPQPGGLTEISLQVQAYPTAEDLGQLYVHLDSDAHCSIRFGKVAIDVKRQPELPMGEPGEESEPATATSTDGGSAEAPLAH